MKQLSWENYAQNIIIGKVPTDLKKMIIFILQDRILKKYRYKCTFSKNNI